MSGELARPLDEFIDREALLQRPLKTAIAIDPVDPLEIDDAISVSIIDRKKRDFRVEVQIADFGLLYGHDELIDDARALGWSQYNDDDPSKTIPMFPFSISLDTLGLDSGDIDGQPAVEVAFDFNELTREIGNVSMGFTRVHIRQLTYPEASRLTDTDREVHRIHRIGSQLNREPGEFYHAERFRRASSSVQQFMLAANHLVALEMEREEIPWLFRNHCDQNFDVWRNEKEQEALRELRVAQYGRIPLPHEGTGFDLYCHFSSPGRRFPDTANHLNFFAHRNGLPIPFDDKEIDLVAEEMTALQIERSRFHRNLLAA